MAYNAGFGNAFHIKDSGVLKRYITETTEIERACVGGIPTNRHVRVCEHLEAHGTRLGPPGPFQDA